MPPMGERTAMGSSLVMRREGVILTYWPLVKDNADRSRDTANMINHNADFSLLFFEKRKGILLGREHLYLPIN